MSFTRTESTETRDRRLTPETSSVEQVFIVTADPGDTVDENDVMDFLISDLPLFFIGLPRQDIEIVERANSLVYKATVEYRLNFETPDEDDDIDPAGETRSFDTTGGTVHLTFAKEVVEKIGDFSEEMGGAINYDGEKIQGVDVVSPSYRWTVTVRKLDSEVTDAYQETLFDLTGTANDQPIKWFLKRDLLFRGAVGSKTRENARDANGDPIEDEWEITYHFDGRKSEVAFKVGQFIVPIKAGWDYVSAVYEDKDDFATKTIVRKVKSVAVLRLLEESDFKELGIDIL